MPLDPKRDDSTIVAFAKWSHPIRPNEDYIEPPWVWPEGTDHKTLDAWIAKAAEAESRSVGDTPCYRTCACSLGVSPFPIGRVFIASLNTNGLIVRPLLHRY